MDKMEKNEQEEISIPLPFSYCLHDTDLTIHSRQMPPVSIPHEVSTETTDFASNLVKSTTITIGNPTDRGYQAMTHKPCTGGCGEIVMVRDEVAHPYNNVMVLPNICTRCALKSRQNMDLYMSQGGLRIMPRPKK